MIVLRNKAARWAFLPDDVREGLTGRLAGLYGQPYDGLAFDALALDKQNALLILYGRLSLLNLWQAVKRVENVYGEGGVGMNFRAWPFLAATLARRKEFTDRFARHGNTAGGFMERTTCTGSLHFLYVDGPGREWGVHFDLYNPWYSPLNAWRHLLEEKWNGYTPDWSRIGQVLGFDFE